MRRGALLDGARGLIELPEGRDGAKKAWDPGLTVGAIGLGCMGMSYAYGTPNDAASIATIQMALNRGVTMLDRPRVMAPTPTRS